MSSSLHYQWTILLVIMSPLLSNADDGLAVWQSYLAQERAENDAFAFSYGLRSYAASDYSGESVPRGPEQATEHFVGVAVSLPNGWGLKMAPRPPLQDESTTNNDASEDASIGEVVGWWDGNTWIERRPRLAQVEINRQPPSAPEMDILGLFAGFQAPTFVGRWSIRELIESTEVVSSERITDPYPGVRIQLRDPTVPAVRVSVDVVEVSRRFWVSSLDYTIVASDHAPVARVVYEVSAWSTWKGQTVPFRAIRDGIMYSADASDEQPAGRMSRVVIERNDQAMLVADAQSDINAAIELRDGDFVSDEALGVRYQVGSTTIHVDGLPYQVPDPVNDRITADFLASLLDTDVNGTSKSEDDSSFIRGFLGQVAIGVLAALVICMVVFLVRRRARL